MFEFLHLISVNLALNERLLTTELWSTHCFTFSAIEGRIVAIANLPTSRRSLTSLRNSSTIIFY